MPSGKRSEKPYTLIHFRIHGRRMAYCTAPQSSDTVDCSYCNGVHQTIPRFVCMSVQKPGHPICPQCGRMHRWSNNLFSLLRSVELRSKWYTSRTSAQLRASRPSLLLNLPAEIRIQIYRVLFSGEQLHHLSQVTVEYRTRQWVLPDRYVPVDQMNKAWSILLTCRQCLNEGLNIWYRQINILNPLVKGRGDDSTFNSDAKGSLVSNMHSVEQQCRKVVYSLTKHNRTFGSLVKGLHHLPALREVEIVQDYPLMRLCRGDTRKDGAAPEFEVPNDEHTLSIISRHIALEYSGLLGNFYKRWILTPDDISRIEMTKEVFALVRKDLKLKLRVHICHIVNNKCVYEEVSDDFGTNEDDADVFARSVLLTYIVEKFSQDWT